MPDYPSIFDRSAQEQGTTPSIWDRPTRQEGPSIWDRMPPPDPQRQAEFFVQEQLQQTLQRMSRPGAVREVSGGRWQDLGRSGPFHTASPEADYDPETDWPRLAQEIRQRHPGVDPAQYRERFEAAIAESRPGIDLSRAIQVQQTRSRDSDDTQRWVRQRYPVLGPVFRGAEAVQMQNSAIAIRDRTASEVDYARVAEFMVEADRRKKETEGWSPGAIGLQVLDLVSHLPGFAVEFAATGGAFTGARALASRGTTAALNRAVGVSAADSLVGRAAAGSVGYVAGSAAQAAAMPQRVFADSARRAVPDINMTNGRLDIRDNGDVLSPGNLLQGYADTMIEVGSERAGEALPVVGRALRRNVPGVAALGDRWAGSAAGRTITGWNQGVQRVARGLGYDAYHGVAGEVFEERVGEVLRGVTGLSRRPDGTADFGVVGDIVAGRFGEAGRQLLVEGIGFAAMPGLYGASQVGHRRFNTGQWLAGEGPPQTPVPGIGRGESFRDYGERVRQVLLDNTRAAESWARTAGQEGLNSWAYENGFPVNGSEDQWREAARRREENPAFASLMWEAFHGINPGQATPQPGSPAANAAAPPPNAAHQPPPLPVSAPPTGTPTAAPEASEPETAPTADQPAPQAATSQPASIPVVDSRTQTEKVVAAARELRQTGWDMKNLPDLQGTIRGMGTLEAVEKHSWLNDKVKQYALAYLGLLKGAQNASAPVPAPSVPAPSPAAAPLPPAAGQGVPTKKQARAEAAKLLFVDHILKKTPREPVNEAARLTKKEAHVFWERWDSIANNTPRTHDSIGQDPIFRKGGAGVSRKAIEQAEARAMQKVGLDNRSMAQMLASIKAENAQSFPTPAEFAAGQGGSGVSPKEKIILSLQDRYDNQVDAYLAARKQGAPKKELAAREVELLRVDQLLQDGETKRANETLLEIEKKPLTHEDHADLAALASESEAQDERDAAAGRASGDATSQPAPAAPSAKPGTPSPGDGTDVLFGPPGATASGPAVAPSGVEGPNPYEFRRGTLAIFNEAGYLGKVPAGARAAYRTRARQLVQDAGMIADSPLLIHEIAHGVSFKNSLPLDVNTLPAEVAKGFQQFDYDPSRGITNTGMEEGFAEWFRLRVTGQLVLSALSKEQLRASTWASGHLAAVKGETEKLDRLTDLYAAMEARSVESKARGMASPSGQPAQPVGMTAREAVGRRASAVAGETQRLLEHRLLPAEQLDTEGARLRGKPVAPGQSLEAVLEVIQHMPERWESLMMDQGVVALVKQADGSRREEIIGPSLKSVAEGFTPDQLNVHGQSFLDAVKKFAGLPVHEESSWLGTFILGSDITATVARGAQQVQSLKDSERAEGQRNLNTASPEQIEAYRKFLDDIEQTDPALFQKANNAYAKYTEFTDASREARVHDGSMTQKQLDAWRAKRPNYVSYARVMEDGGYTVAIGKERKGSARQFVDPFTTGRDLNKLRAREMVQRLTDEAIMRAGNQGKNVPAGVSNFYREIPNPKEADTTRVNVESRLKAMGYDQTTIDAITSFIGSEFELARPWRDGASNIYTATTNGEKHVLEMQNKSLYDLVSNQTGSNSDSKLVSGVARIVSLPGFRHLAEGFKWAATSSNMIFNVRNPVRDPWQYAMNVTGRGRGFMQDLLNLVRGHISSFGQKGRKLGGFDMNNPLFRLYDEGGSEALRGPYAFGHLGKAEAAWRVIRGTSGNFGAKVVYAMEKTKDFLEFVGAGEHGPRFAEYKNYLLEAGYTEKQISDALEKDPNVSPISISDHIAGMQRAARATVQFGRQGELTHELNKVIPFLTPTIAGLSQEVRNWKGAVKEMSAGTFGPKSKAMVGALGVYLAAELLHAFVMKDEDWYIELPEHLRYNWWILGQKKDGGVWGIPKPQGLLRMIGAYAQEALRASSGKNPNLGMANRHVLRDTTPRLMPWGVGEAVAVASNESWAGRPIVPVRSQREDTDWDQWMQYKIPYLFEQLSGGLLSKRFVRPPWEAFESSQSLPAQSVSDYYDALNTVTRERIQSQRRMQVYPRENDYRVLHGIEQRMSALGAEARGERRVGGRTVRGEVPGDERLRKIRADQVELARRAMRTINR